MKKLSLKEIKEGKLIGKPEKVSVQIKVDGEDAEFETYLKPFNYDTAVANFKAFGESREALAGILASCICDESGKLEFTEQEIRQNFNQALVEAIWLKVVEVNSLGKNQNSAQTTNSSLKSQDSSVKPSAKSASSRSRKSKRMQPMPENTEASISDAESNKS